MASVTCHLRSHTLTVARFKHLGGSLDAYNQNHASENVKYPLWNLHSHLLFKMCI